MALWVVVGLGDGARAGNFVYASSVVVLAWLSGRAVALARERATLLADHRRSQERSLMARELHDVVTHAMSAIVIQASAERRSLAPGSDTAGVLHSIEDQGREALRELRRLLGVLTLDEAGGAPLSPQPGLADLPRLVESARHHGLDVTLRTSGTPGQLGPGAELALYRVVQEALTNAGKHAGRHHAEVSLAWRGDEVEVEVVSHGRSGRGRRLPGSGFGPRSMAERVQAYGGVLNARPTNEGFRVLAQLPPGARVTSVLVVDDQALVRAGLARILDGEPDIEVVDAPDGERAVCAGSARRGPDGHPHAAPRRDRGDRHDLPRDPGAGLGADHVRPRRVCLRRATCRGERLPPQGRRRSSGVRRCGRRCPRSTRS